jgi:hypothetical protein
MLPGREGGTDAGVSAIDEFAKDLGDGSVIARFVTNYDEQRSTLAESSKRTAREFTKPRRPIVQIATFAFFVALGIFCSTQFEFYGYFRNVELSGAKIVLLLTIFPLLMFATWIRYLGRQASSSVVDGIAQLLSTEETVLSTFEKGLFFEGKQCSVFWTYDSLRNVWPHKEGIVLVSGALVHFIPDRGFLPSFPRSKFMELLQEKAKHIAPSAFAKIK